MAKVLLHSVSLDDPKLSGWMEGAYKLFTESAGIDRYAKHSLTSDPNDADIIIFTELGCHGNFAERVRRHPYVKEYREKCFLFDIGDRVLPMLPGVYASLRKKYYDPARTRTGYYLRLDENPYVGFRPPQENYQYLASFIGSICTSPVRTKLLELPRESFFVEDTSSFSLKMLMSKENNEARHRFWSHYANAIASAPFALCPRGAGPGSIRLFEVMQMGRVPVIIADEWVYPERVDWQACSISVPEEKVAEIPEILRNFRSRAAEMGLRARREWEKYYSPEARFHWLVEDCLTMRQRRRLPEAIACRLVWRHFFNCETFRMYLAAKKHLYRETGKVML